MAPNNTVLPEGPYPGETVRSPITGSEAVRLAVTGANYRASVDNILGAGRPVTGSPFRIPTVTAGLGDSWFSRSEPTFSGQADAVTTMAYNANNEAPTEPQLSWAIEANYLTGGVNLVEAYFQYFKSPALSRPIYARVNRATNVCDQISLSGTDIYLIDDLNGAFSGATTAHITPGQFQMTQVPGQTTSFVMDCPSGQYTQFYFYYNAQPSMQWLCTTRGHMEYYALSASNPSGAFVLSLWPETATGNGPNVCIGTWDGAAQFVQNMDANQTNTVGHIMKGKASQTADFFQAWDSSSNIVYRVRADGSYGNLATTVSALPSATIATGLRSFVTDATTSAFAATATGGGSSRVPVYSDGTVWRIG